MLPNKRLHTKWLKRGLKGGARKGANTRLHGHQNHIQINQQKYHHNQTKTYQHDIHPDPSPAVSPWYQPKDQDLLPQTACNLNTQTQRQRLLDFGFGF
jgi:hypothetical protein